MKARVTIGLTEMPPGQADQLFALTGQPSVEQRLASIAATAKALLDNVKARTCPHRPAVVNRWIERHMRVCTQVFHSKIPVELVELIEHQLGVAGRKRDARKNPDKFIAAAHYKAAHPDATPSKIARAIGYDQKKQIQVWLADPDFVEIVERDRHRLRWLERKSQEG